MKTSKTTSSKSMLLTSQFQFQATITANAFDGLSQHDSLKRADHDINHSNWLLGHIVHCRFMLAGMLGVKETNPFGEVYWKAISAEAQFDIEQIRLTFNTISSQLYEALGEFNNEQLEQALADGQPPLENIISFFVYHEAYHLGQLGQVRKLIGLETLKSN